jgi:hypothetical protein
MTVKDYPSMLKFIAFGTSAVMLVCFAVLYNNSQIVKELFQSIPNYTTKVKGIPISTHYLIPPLVWFFISYFFRVHDKISNIFKIRYHFDCQYILLPMANDVGIALKKQEREKIFQARNSLMRKVFYKYADSTDPKISKHNIYKALTNWALYWTCIESITLLLLFLIILLFLQIFRGALVIAILVIILTFFSKFFYKSAIVNVSEEIELIYQVDNALQEIEKEFRSALQN